MPVPITHPCGIHRVDYYGDRSVGNVSLRKLWITCCMVLRCHIHVRGVCLASTLPVGRPALAAVAHLVKIERGRKQRLPRRVTQQPSAGLPFADLQSSFSPRVDFIGYSGMSHTAEVQWSLSPFTCRGGCPSPQLCAHLPGQALWPRPSHCSSVPSLSGQAPEAAETVSPETVSGLPETGSAGSRKAALASSQDVKGSCRHPRRADRTGSSVAAPASSVSDWPQTLRESSDLTAPKTRSQGATCAFAGAGDWLAQGCPLAEASRGAPP